jgi:hypothetical protein
MEVIRGIDALLEGQLKEWELASSNYADLKNVRSRTINFDGFTMLVQFNPKRIVSSAAKVDAKSIASRPCFLCRQNRPVQQRGIAFKEEYIILLNPFPIFPKHLTVPQEIHANQMIGEHFEDMLELAAGLNDYVVFYNGPKCGASAPDHFHFQAGSKGFLPIEKDFQQKTRCKLFKTTDEVTVYEWSDYLRTVVTFQSNQKEKLSILFYRVCSRLAKLQPAENEPMMNIIAYREDETWVVHLFPRILHRPNHYFEEGEKQLLLSPASVDLGGVLITPREEDFLKITAEQVADIFSQVCMDNHTLLELI